MIAAFDLGIKNFAFAIKNKGQFILLKHLNLNENMTKTDLNKYKKKDLVDLMSNLNISSEKKIKKNDMIDLILKREKNKVKMKQKDICLSLIELMDSFNHIWQQCETFLIERQMTTNLQALKLSHYLEAYLKIHFSSKKILNYNATTKTKKLGATDLKTKKDRKKWTIQYAYNFLSGDNLRLFENLKKKDDIADAICMIESYLL